MNSHRRAILLAYLLLNSCSSEHTAVQPDNRYTKEPLFNQQWYLEENKSFYLQYDVDSHAGIHTRGVLNRYAGKGVTVAIIDNGCDVNHPDLEDAIKSTYNVATHSKDVSHSLEADYHGTAVAGIVGARINQYGIAGIAYRSDLAIVKLNLRGFVSSLEIVDALEQASKMGAWVINNSWGSESMDDFVSDELHHLATEGRDGKGIVIVFASGNGGYSLDTAGLHDESEHPDVLGVGATTRENIRAYYSNYGSNLDIVAPGGDEEMGITTLDPVNKKGKNIEAHNDAFLYPSGNHAFMGTSAAAPIVSGAIAVMLGVNPDLTREQIFDILKRTSDKIGSYSYDTLFDGTSRNDYYGYGKLNLKKAVESVNYSIGQP